MNKDTFMSIVCLQNLNNMYVKMHCLLLYHFDWNFIYFCFALKMSKLSVQIDTNELFKQKAAEKDQSFLNVRSESYEFGNMQYK